MATLNDQFFEAMYDALKDHALDDRTEEIMATVATEAAPKVAAALLKELKRRAPAMLKSEGAKEVRFQARNRRRWKRPLDQLRMIVTMAEEAGSELVDEWSAGEEEQYVFAALNHLHVKALLTSREIICLIEGGFADAALARWRTLHELSVFAMFLSKADEHTARRFVASFDFKALKAARQLNEHADQANLERFSDSDLADMARICAAHTAELGPGLGEDYGWTKPNLVAKRLEDIERATGLEHWRPRYRWASQSIHGAFRPPLASLGMAETREVVHLVGPSNSGMVDPLQMCALSLSAVSGAFLSRWADFDRLVFANAIAQAAGQVGEIALRAEEVSARRAAASKPRKRASAI